MKKKIHFLSFISIITAFVSFYISDNNSKKIRQLFLINLLFISFSFSALSQNFRFQAKKYSEQPDTTGEAEGETVSRTIYGTVRSMHKSEFLAIATISVLGTRQGVFSSERGTFFINLDVSKPQKLICFYLGFENDTVIVNEKTSFINFRLREKFVSSREVVVSASRKSERKFESPVSIETINMRELQYNPTINLYDRVVNLAGVDAITTSIVFKVINTRGFNTTYNRRFIQRFDNMDLSMPALNISAGMLNGPVDLDVERVEIIPGTASALYGPNILNGLMNTYSKNPFQYRGLSACLKTGVNHIDGMDAKPGPVFDLSFRYANVLNKYLAYKVTLGYMNANDWHATDYRDVSDYAYSNNLSTYGYKPGYGNPGYDGTNIGGDEVALVFDSSYKFKTQFGSFSLLKDPLKIARTGYAEDQVFNYKTYNFKTDLGLYYHPDKQTEISYNYRVCMGNANYLLDARIHLESLLLQQHKLEVKYQNHTLRTYVSMEHLRSAYAFGLASMLINRAAKADANWFAQYLMAYSGRFNDINKALNLGYDSIPRANDAAARKFADTDNSQMYASMLPLDSTLAKYMLGRARLQPGSKEFELAYNDAISRGPNDGGASLYSTSKMWYTEYIFDFKNLIKSVSVLAGGNYRLYTPASGGTLFSDAITPIYSNETGIFIQAKKDLMDKRLMLQASGRVDYMQRFEPRFSPRVSTVLLLGQKRQNSLRASAQIGFRTPSLTDQFTNILLPGYYNFGGFYNDAAKLNLAGTFNDGTDYINLYTQSSVKEYFYTHDSSKLIKPFIKNIKPEEVRTLEIGMRNFWYGKLETDFSFYLNYYQNLIGSEQYIGPITRTDTINAVYISDPQRTIIYRKSVNSKEPVLSYGLSFAFIYFLSQKTNLHANYNYNAVKETNAYLLQDFVSGFNTPAHKINLGISSVKILKNFGFTCNFRWVDGYNYHEYHQSGHVEGYYLIDMMISYHVPKHNTMFKLAGSNISNNRYSQAIGAPMVGAVFYFSVLYDDLLR
ncbi:MAG: TonB-dependent receptor [Bacteroidota bacterium]|nr:TonB-dependent receptor [Bacteroidota bacterium]